MEKNKLLEEANKARKIAVSLAENIYRYLGNVISKDELKKFVDSVISDDILIRLDHMYIKKDTYKNTFITGFSDDLEDTDITDDTETLVINDKQDSKGE